MNVLKFRDLPEQSPVNIALYCSNCGDGPFAASRSIYPFFADDTTIDCTECGGNMEFRESNVF